MSTEEFSWQYRIYPSCVTARRERRITKPCVAILTQHIEVAILTQHTEIVPRGLSKTLYRRPYFSEDTVWSTFPVGIFTKLKSEADSCNYHIDFAAYFSSLPFPAEKDEMLDVAKHCSRDEVVDDHIKYALSVLDLFASTPLPEGSRCFAYMTHRDRKLVSSGVWLSMPHTMIARWTEEMGGITIEGRGQGKKICQALPQDPIEMFRVMYLLLLGPDQQDKA